MWQLKMENNCTFISATQISFDRLSPSALARGRNKPNEEKRNAENEKRKRNKYFAHLAVVVSNFSNGRKKMKNLLNIKFVVASRSLRQLCKCDFRCCRRWIGVSGESQLKSIFPLLAVQTRSHLTLTMAALALLCSFTEHHNNSCVSFLGSLSQFCVHFTISTTLAR